MPKRDGSLLSDLGQALASSLTRMTFTSRELLALLFEGSDVFLDALLISKRADTFGVSYHVQAPDLVHPGPLDRIQQCRL